MELSYTTIQTHINESHDMSSAADRGMCHDRVWPVSYLSPHNPTRTYIHCAWVGYGSGPHLQEATVPDALMLLAPWLIIAGSVFTVAKLAGKYRSRKSDRHRTDENESARTVPPDTWTPTWHPAGSSLTYEQAVQNYEEARDSHPRIPKSQG